MSIIGFPFKVAIFDLDLTLWDGKNLYEDAYDILYTMKNTGVKLYVVSYNLFANKVCQELGISKFFDQIFERRRIPKSIIVNYITQSNKTTKHIDTTFYDDRLDNITDVKMRSRAVPVLVENGIKWTDIICCVKSSFVQQVVSYNEEQKKKMYEIIEKKYTYEGDAYYKQ